jgi:hypothetical protein
MHGVAIQDDDRHGEGPKKAFYAFRRSSFTICAACIFSGHQKIDIPAQGIVDIYPIRVYDCLSAVADVFAKYSGWFSIATVNVE